MALTMPEKRFRNLALRFEGRSLVSSLGECYFDYSFSATEGTATKVAEWSGTHSSMQILARSIFRVRRTA